MASAQPSKPTQPANPSPQQPIAAAKTQDEAKKPPLFKDFASI